MRIARWVVITSYSMLGAGTTLCVAGCQGDAANCDNVLTCTGDSGKPAGGSKDPDCNASPDQLHGAPLAKCGIFADPSATGTGDGSMSAPFRSLQSAITAAAAAEKPVYACGAEFAEHVKVPSGTTIYGGLDCTHGWVWKADDPTIVKPIAATSGSIVSEIGMTLAEGMGDTVIQDVDVIAPDAALPGVSSIAVVIGDTRADLTRCHLTSGAGADGATGEHLQDDPMLNGISGEAGFAICAAAAVNPGAIGPSKTCGGADSTGGTGGAGGPPGGADLNGGDGQVGAPQDSTLPMAGIGGGGQTTTSCTPGTQGADGVQGTSGHGGSGLGVLSIAGLKSHDGAPGGAGQPGQGGGGGGGAKGKIGILCPGSALQDRAGASGGSGGTGGCGGARGGGGQAGGSSIALVSIGMRKVALSNVAVLVGKAGAGGQGGEGQSGGNRGLGAPGGQGFSGTSSACTGGDGGQGGNGGPGGGGQGGSAVGIAFSGLAPIGEPSIVFKSMPPTGGAGGPAGPGTSDAAAGAGANGTAAQTLKLAP